MNQNPGRSSKISRSYSDRTEISMQIAKKLSAKWSIRAIPHKNPPHKRGRFCFMFVSVTKNDDPVQENLESAPFYGGILVEGDSYVEWS